MTTGQTVLLKQDITSGKKVLYAKANDEVTITCVEHFPVMIVATKTGNRFSVHIDNLKEKPVKIPKW